MKKFRIRFVLKLCAVCLVFAYGCGQKKEMPEATKGSSQNKLELAFITNVPADFWTIARRGCEKAIEELGNADLDFRINDGDTAGQKRIVEDLLARKIDGLAISLVDPVNQTLLVNNAAKKTLVFTQDSDAPGSDRACYVGTDNMAAGRMAGDEIKKVLPDGGKIMVFVGKRDSQNALERFNGIKEVLEGSLIEIIDLRTDDGDRVRAKANVADTLVKYPDISCLVGLWAYNGPAILNAVEEAGKIGKVKIVCFDEEEQTLRGVKNGAIFSTVVQQPYEFGYQCMKLMAATLAGDNAAIPENKTIIVPTMVITRENVDEFHARLNTLLGKG